MRLSSLLPKLLRPNQRSRPKKELRRCPRLEPLETRDLLATWTPLSHLAPTGAGIMLLLPDGRVMMQGSGVSKNWYQLTPTATGSYINGTWGTLASMDLERQYFASTRLSPFEADKYKVSNRYLVTSPRAATAASRISMKSP